MQSSLKFGTSGLRGLADELDGAPAYRYVRAFIEVMRARGCLDHTDKVFIGRDLRGSSAGIGALSAAAIEDAGYVAVDCGTLPTPALTHYASMQGAPAVMVTGSHIPDDRNGLKFFRPDGEIDKADEAAISFAYAELSSDLPIRRSGMGQTDVSAIERYRARYLDFLGGKTLRGLTVGIYQHSSVARDILVEVLQELGAEVLPLGRSDRFIPVDTEALRDEDVELLRQWAVENKLDAIVSTDGDADRPLIADDKGRFIRGDLVGAITADWLKADCIVTPVTANSALETCGRFEKVVRTKVGSPFVIASMEDARVAGAARVVGFEANGGVLLGSSVQRDGNTLAPLATRDAFLPVLACLDSIGGQAKPLSYIASQFGFRAAKSDRLKQVAPEASAAFLTQLQDRNSGIAVAFSSLGDWSHSDATDGVKIFITSGEVVHYRASGNAPELRCYVEAHDDDRAAELLSRGLAFALENVR